MSEVTPDPAKTPDAEQPKAAKKAAAPKKQD